MEASLEQRIDPRCEYHAYGGAAEYLLCEDPVVLLEGPANTGKTRAVLQKDLMLCMQYPGVRILWVRDTLKSLRESVLVTWEMKVLPGGAGHKCVQGTASRYTRTHYLFPYDERYDEETGRWYSGQSTIVLGGMDVAEHFFSTEWDYVRIFEACVRIPYDSYQKFFRSLRNKAGPYHQLTADTNPGSEFHYWNQLANKGEITRILSRHEDNPACTEDDLDWLRKLTGVDRDRLYLGKWVSESGQVWETFQMSTNVVEWETRYDARLDRHYIYDPRDQENTERRLTHFVAAMDFGWTNPACLQIWGFDRDGYAFMVAEVYRTKWKLDKWAEVCWELRQEFPFRHFVCESAEPRTIEFFNDFLQSKGVARIARKADKTTFKRGKHGLAGLDLVRQGFVLDDNDQPRLRFVKNALRYGRDPELGHGNRPCCTVEEIGSYVFLKAEDGKPIPEEPDPACANHGCDALRYMMMFVHKKNLTPIERPQRYPPGTLGHLYQIDKVLDPRYKNGKLIRRTL